MLKDFGDYSIFMYQLKKNFSSKEDLFYITHPLYHETEARILDSLLPILFRHYNLFSKCNIFATVGKDENIELYPIADNTSVDVKPIVSRNRLENIFRVDSSWFTLIEIKEAKFKVYQDYSSYLLDNKKSM